MELKEVIRTINKMVSEGIVESYAIGGAVGATFYLEPVSTFDVDIFVAFKVDPESILVSPAPVFDYLKDQGYVMEGEYFVIGGWPVQFLPPNSPLVENALKEASTQDVDGEPVSVLSAEHLAAIALEVGRPKDKTRLLQFIEAESIDMEIFLRLIQEYDLSKKWDKFKQLFLTDE